MFEHLSQDGAKSFIKEVKRVLKSGGVVRIAVPDLKIYTDAYLKSGDADTFMKRLLVQAPEIKTLKQKINLLVSGYRHHQWMYDGNSLKKLLLEMGLKNAAICTNGKTNISNYGALDLFERKKNSVYVEAIN